MILDETRGIESSSLNKLLRKSPFEKGEIGGFALDHLGKIPPKPPLAKGGEYYLRASFKG